ncbi:hypothetical protein E1A91_D06G139400v1 [Gossypium mustelinum]|uniref:Uncharacterized protein n=1 Tax=Gossypium mustelinum TaxID=34275 RepID=A0A5D2UHZ4_GOSMU|nr:hypothetical protein E1A91_D06G139400v1 [Gossypium mustelinum]
MEHYKNYKFLGESKGPLFPESLHVYACIKSFNIDSITISQCNRIYTYFEHIPIVSSDQ